MPPAIDALIAGARTRLREAGIPSDEAALDARLLARHVLGWDATRLMTHGDELAPDEVRSVFDELVTRRSRREPLAYITGSREFWNLVIEVTPAVLIPRPETELLVEAALEQVDRSLPLRIVDACTGSGCVAVALAAEFTRSTFIVTDLSSEALAVARRNLTRHGALPRTQIVETDLLGGLEGPFDLIVANPPYVPSADKEGLQPEVRLFEPASALFAGADGLDIIRRLLGSAASTLAPSGLLIFECGIGQADAIRALIAQQRSLAVVDVKHDLQQIPRVVIVRRL